MWTYQCSRRRTVTKHRGPGPIEVTIFSYLRLFFFDVSGAAEECNVLTSTWNSKISPGWWNHFDILPRRFHQADSIFCALILFDALLLTHPKASTMTLVPRSRIPSPHSKYTGGWLVRRGGPGIMDVLWRRRKRDTLDVRCEQCVSLLAGNYAGFTHDKKGDHAGLAKLRSKIDKISIQQGIIRACPWSSPVELAGDWCPFLNLPIKSRLSNDIWIQEDIRLVSLRNPKTCFITILWSTC